MKEMQRENIERAKRIKEYKRNKVIEKHQTLNEMLEKKKQQAFITQNSAINRG